MKPIRSLTILCSSLVLLAACSSTPKVDLTPTAPTTPVTQQPPAQTDQTPLTYVKPVEIPDYLNPKSALSKTRSVYFDYDVFTVKPEFSNLVELHGKYLASHPQLSIRVEGNADERGSSEYNLALGQKRAESVVRALKVYGVKDAQVEAVSLGKEKPVATGHDEAAYAQNRRVDLGYPSK